MKKNSLAPDLTTLNKLIKSITYFQNSIETKCQKVIEMLKEMNSYGIRPNLQTFNNCLFAIRNNYSQKSSQLALDILKEMEILKIGN